MSLLLNLLFLVVFIIFFSTSAAAQRECKHICECLPPMVSSNASSGTLNSCLRLQGLYRSSSTIFLVASDCVYSLNEVRLMPIYWHPRLFLFDEYTNLQTLPVPWTRHPRYQNLIKELGPSYFFEKTLLYHTFFITHPTPGAVDKVEMLSFEGDRIYLRNGFPEKLNISKKFERFFRFPFNGVTDGHFGENGYVLVANGSVTTFWDRGAFYGHKAPEKFAGYLLQFNPGRDAGENKSEARFVVQTSDRGPDEDQGWRSIPSPGGMPFGVQHNTSTVLVDVHEEKVYIFPTLPLDGSLKTDFLLRSFPLKAMSLQDFLSCRPKRAKSPRTTEVPLVWTARILFLSLTILAVCSLCAVSLYAFFCQRSSIKDEVLKAPNRNVRYNYRSLGGGSSRRSKFGGFSYRPGGNSRMITKRRVTGAMLGATKKMGKKKMKKMKLEDIKSEKSANESTSKTKTTSEKEVASVPGRTVTTSTTTATTSKTSNKS